MRLDVRLSSHDDCPNIVILQGFLDALMVADQVYLIEHPETPSLYRSGVLYAPESGAEEWCDIGECLKRGRVDCEDLACWRAAELRQGGSDARAIATCERLGPKRRLYHIVVEIQRDGQVIIEDPSLLLGML